MAPLVLGSRGSALALAQVQLVKDALEACNQGQTLHPAPEIELRIITTSGDRRQDVTAAQADPGGLKGLFTKEIQDALLGGSIAAAVHSLKDLPGVTPAALTIAAVLPRADSSDLLVSSAYPSLESLPPGARVGTGSVRRRRQIGWLRQGLDISDLRGNVPTRLQKLATGSLDAIVLARAGLERLGYTITEGRLHCDAGIFHATPLDILPAIGQGVIGIETRRDDAAALSLFSAIDHAPTHACIRVERELLRLLDGDCRLPVGARATLDAAGLLQAEAIVFRDDTSAPAQARATGPASDPEAVARALFERL